MNTYISFDSNNDSQGSLKASSDKRAVAIATERGAATLMRVWCGGMREVALPAQQKPSAVKLDLTELERIQKELQASKQQAIHLHNALMMIEAMVGCGLDTHSRKIALESVGDMAKNALEKYGVKH